MTRQPVIVASSQSIESQLDEVGKSIKSVEEEIKQNTAAIGSVTDATMRAFLMGKDPQLRDALKDLREEKKQLSKQKSDDAEMIALSTFVLICCLLLLFFLSRAHQSRSCFLC